MPDVYALATTITIDLMDLLLGLLIAVGVILGIFLIVLLAKLVSTFKKINKLVDDLDEPVNKTVVQLPDLIKKLDTVSADVAVITESAKEALPVVLEDTQAMTGSIRGGVEALGGAAKVIAEGLATFIRPAAPEPARTGGIGTVLDILGQVMAVANFFTSRKKSSNRKKAKSKSRK